MLWMPRLEHHAHASNWVWEPLAKAVRYNDASGSHSGGCRRGNELRRPSCVDRLVAVGSKIRDAASKVVVGLVAFCIAERQAAHRPQRLPAPPGLSRRRTRWTR